MMSEAVHCIIASYLFIIKSINIIECIVNSSASDVHVELFDAQQMLL